MNFINYCYNVMETIIITILAYIYVVSFVLFEVVKPISEVFKAIFFMRWREEEQRAFGRDEFRF